MSDILLLSFLPFPAVFACLAESEVFVFARCTVAVMLSIVCELGEGFTARAFVPDRRRVRQSARDGLARSVAPLPLPHRSL